MAETRELTSLYGRRLDGSDRLAIEEKIDEAKAEMQKDAATAAQITKAFNEVAKSKENIGKKCFDEPRRRTRARATCSSASLRQPLSSALDSAWFIARMTSKVLAALIGETRRLTEATVEGQAPDPRKPRTGYPRVPTHLEGVNKLIDAFVGPINVTAEYVDRISKGDIPPKITDTYNGDFNEIKNNLNACIDVMNGLLRETNTLIQATQDGKLQTRGNAQQFAGGWGELVGGVNKLIDAFVAPINVTAEYVDRISKGDIPPKITDTYNGDFNEIKNNLNACIDVMNGLLRETNTLIQATQDGKLQTRGNAQQFAGGWGELVGGVNKLIDAFVAPINVTAEYVDRISKGDMPAEDHRQLQRRFQRDQEQPQPVHRCHQRPDRRGHDAGEGRGRRQTGHPGRRREVPGQVPRDHRRHEQHAGRLRQPRSRTSAKALKRHGRRRTSRSRREANYPGDLRRTARQREPRGREHPRGRRARSTRAPASSPKGSRVIAESSQTPGLRGPGAKLQRRSR